MRMMSTVLCIFTEFCFLLRRIALNAWERETRVPDSEETSNDRVLPVSEDGEKLELPYHSLSCQFLPFYRQLIGYLRQHS